MKCFFISAFLGPTWDHREAVGLAGWIQFDRNTFYIHFVVEANTSCLVRFLSFLSVHLSELSNMSWHLGVLRICCSRLGHNYMSLLISCFYFHFLLYFCILGIRVHPLFWCFLLAFLPESIGLLHTIFYCRNTPNL